MSKQKKQKTKRKAHDDPNSRVVCRNRKARHNYELQDELECGIVLRGSEVKSIRNGKVSIDEAYARIRDDELWLINSDIAEYPQATVMNHEPKRARKLLLKKRELRKFAETAVQSGLTLVPLSVYFHRGLVKVKVAIGKGRKTHDKRDKIRSQEDRKSMRVAKMNRM